jgi:hypothetical protein
MGDSTINSSEGNIGTYLWNTQEQPPKRSVVSVDQNSRPEDEQVKLGPCFHVEKLGQGTPAVINRRSII